MAKKIQVTLADGIVEILDDLRKNVYKSKSMSSVCSSIISSYLSEKSYLKEKYSSKK